MNSYQLVIRCDTTNGYYKVGWTSELPLGRFEHIELLVETKNPITLNSKNPHFSIFAEACKRVSTLNKVLLTTEQERHESQGWRNVPLNLNDSTVQIKPDEFGCYNNLATKTRYRLSMNSSDVWAVIKNSEVIQVIARYPKNKIPELKYQIWKHTELDKLHQLGGDVVQGRLAVCNSGLWFIDNILA